LSYHASGTSRTDLRLIPKDLFEGERSFESYSQIGIPIIKAAMKGEGNIVADWRSEIMNAMCSMTPTGLLADPPDIDRGS